MFCPRCGSSQSDELKFCKGCGANLFAVRQVVDNRETAETTDWGNNWMAEVVNTHQDAKMRREAIERQRGITPEVKLRYDEIKGGVITGTVGLGIGIFLYVFMQGVILSGNVTPASAQILSHLWVAGVLPLFVGIALIINGMFVSKKLVDITRRNLPTSPNSLEGDSNPKSLRPADTNEFIPTGFSVTEHTTKHLGGSGRK
jgi:hypothetical protein